MLNLGVKYRPVSLDQLPEAAGPIDKMNEFLRANMSNHVSPLVVLKICYQNVRNLSASERTVA